MNKKKKKKEETCAKKKKEKRGESTGHRRYRKRNGQAFISRKKKATLSALKGWNCSDDRKKGFYRKETS